MEVLDLEWDSSHAHGELSTLAVEQGYGGGGGILPPRTWGRLEKPITESFCWFQTFLLSYESFPPKDMDILYRPAR